MADFDKIKINGVPYNVKDTATAQTVTQQGQTIAQQGQQISQQGQAIAQQGQQISQQGQAIAQQGQQIEQQGQQIAQQGQQIAQQGQQIDKLQQTITAGEIGTVIFCGDSYGRGAGSAGDSQYAQWPVLTSTFLNLTHYYNACVSASGFTQAGNLAFSAQLDTAAGHVDPNAVTHVVVAGGFNDRSGLTTDQIKAFVTKAISLFPNAKVLVAAIAWSTDSNARTDLANSVIPTYIAGAAESGAVYISNSEYSLHNYTWFDRDGIHPNDNGQKNIARCIAQGILTGSCDNKYSVSDFAFIEDKSTGYTLTTNNGGHSVYIDNGLTCLFMQTTSMITVVPANGTIQDTLPFKICKFNNNLVRGILVDSFTKIPIIGNVQSAADNYFVPVNGILSLKNDDVYLSVTAIKKDGTGFATNNITAILVYPVTTTAQTLFT